MASVCLILFSGLSTSNPGVIPSREVACSLLNVFPQNSMQSSGTCRTCRVPRPGRSKHCRFCGNCCCKYDHHCIWVNNCIGLLNWRLFFAFLIANFSLCVYGTILIPKIISAEIDRLRLWDAYYVTPTGARARITRSKMADWVVSRHPTLFSLALACAVFGLLLGCFIAYHTYLHFYLRRTTNESMKPDVEPSTQPLWDTIKQDLLPLQWLQQQPVPQTKARRAKRKQP
eukprot:Blabericola_migrator_1__7075@NODE_3589_length_1656_cov_90_242291_g748_i1_p1_GENE_NODE_3589_length_1656_cov_90_242291_g748_i1NODE_3589_length_1656_cov_90_242291_g748_i1_p1_ORF_typecomplete_len229_score11_20DHHC/PF01529_20/8_6e31MBD/PF01429_19/0_2_NODE_3589_length_1656_cov_90_242291_g748_i18511537